VDATRRHERLIPYPRAGADHASDYQGPFGDKITLVTKQQAGHSYPINPGSLTSGAILTTSSIIVLHRGHAKPFFGRSATPHTTPGDRVRSCISPVTTRQRANGFYMEEKRGTQTSEGRPAPCPSGLGCQKGPQKWKKWLN
jgi:hypothetical protein